MTARAPVASIPRAIAGSLVVSALDAALLAGALGGIAALWAHARALGLLTVWLVGGLFLSLRRPVRVHDPVGAAAEPRWTLAVLFLLPLFIPPLAAYGERLGVWLFPGDAALRWAGVAISGAGLAVRIAAMTRLGSRFSPLLVAQRDHTLETAGIYSAIRHPGYLGTLLAAGGAVIAFGSGLGLVLWLPLWFVLDQRTRREDAFLAQRFGDAYRHWRERTGRFLPRVGRTAS